MGELPRFGNELSNLQNPLRAVRVRLDRPGRGGVSGVQPRQLRGMGAPRLPAAAPARVVRVRRSGGRTRRRRLLRGPHLLAELPLARIRDGAVRARPGIGRPDHQRDVAQDRLVPQRVRRVRLPLREAGADVRLRRRNRRWRPARSCRFARQGALRLPLPQSAVFLPRGAGRAPARRGRPRRSLRRRLA